MSANIGLFRGSVLQFNSNPISPWCSKGNYELRMGNPSSQGLATTFNFHPHILIPKPLWTWKRAICSCPYLAYISPDPHTQTGAAVLPANAYLTQSSSLSHSGAINVQQQEMLSRENKDLTASKLRLVRMLLRLWACVRAIPFPSTPPQQIPLV